MPYHKNIFVFTSCSYHKDIGGKPRNHTKSNVKVKVKWYLYRPDVAQRVDRGIALLFHDRGTRRGWVVSSTPRPHFTPEKDTVPVLQEAGWDPGPVWRGGKSRPHRNSIPDRPARSSVATPPELPGPHKKQCSFENRGWELKREAFFFLWLKGLSLRSVSGLTYPSVYHKRNKNRWDKISSPSPRQRN